MKRAKLILGGMVLFVITGGVFASKVNREDHFLYFPSTVGGACNSTVFGVTTIPNTGAKLIRSATTLTSATCPLTTAYFTD